MNELLILFGILMILLTVIAITGRSPVSHSSTSYGSPVKLKYVSMAEYEMGPASPSISESPSLSPSPSLEAEDDGEVNEYEEIRCKFCGVKSFSGEVTCPHCGGPL